jgi:hypothetical protein
MLLGMEVGDVVSGTITSYGQHTWTVTLDGAPDLPLGWLGPLDLSWGAPLNPVVDERISTPNCGRS